MNLETVNTQTIAKGREENPGKRLDLRDRDLSGADLRGANLVEADLRWADLSGANLYGWKGNHDTRNREHRQTLQCVLPNHKCLR